VLIKSKRFVYGFICFLFKILVSWAGQWIINEWAYLSLVFLSTSSSMPACRLQKQRQFA
jgi:hypothetical protein